MSHTTYPESIPVAGFGRNGLPVGKGYVYQGDGHDAINARECDCGRCGYLRRYPNPARPSRTREKTQQ